MLIVRHWTKGNAEWTCAVPNKTEKTEWINLGMLQTAQTIRFQFIFSTENPKSYITFYWDHEKQEHFFYFWKFLFAIFYFRKVLLQFRNDAIGNYSTFQMK